MEVFSLKPILYKADATDFSTQGIGVLVDAHNQKVTEERNGQFYYELDYLSTGRLITEIENDRILKIDASKKLKNQLFRIVKVNKKEDGWITIFAEHVSYITQALALKPEVVISSKTAKEALQIWKSNIIDPNPITVDSNIITSNSTNFDFETVENARRALGGVQGSILDVWGGEYEFDNYNINLRNARGAKRNVVIAYGKNLKTLDQEEQIQNTYTTIYPFAKFTKENEQEETLITLPEYYVDADTVDKFSHRRILKMDFSDDGKEITVDQLRKMAQAYVKNNDVGLPKVSLDVSYLDLSQTLDYANLQAFEEVNLCDIVKVYFEKLGVNVEAKVKKVIYDPDASQYSSIELGDARYSLSEKLKEMENVIGDLVDSSVTGDLVQSMIDYQTALISGTKGGAMVTRFNDEGKPFELLFLDTDNVNTAIECLRINRNGIGFSTSGVNGPFNTAWTIDGKFNASYIRVGKIQSEGLLIDMDTGEVKFSKGAITGPGLSVNMTTGEVILNKGKIASADGSFSIDIATGNIKGGVIEGAILRSKTSMLAGIELQSGALRVMDSNSNVIGELRTQSLSGGAIALTAKQGKEMVIGTEYNSVLGAVMKIPSGSTLTAPILEHYGTQVFKNSKVDFGLGAVKIPVEINSDGTVARWYNVNW